MNFNKSIITEILGDLKALGKKIYLDSPDMWIDFEDKVSDGNLDEMILFFATKYNYLNIVKFIVENNIVNLDAPSKNSKYKSIKEHLLKASVEFNSKDIHDFLINYDKTKSNSDYSTSNTEEDVFDTIIKSVEDTITSFCDQLNPDNLSSQSKPKYSTDKETQKDSPLSSIADILIKKMPEEGKENIDIKTKNNQDIEDTTSESNNSCYQPKFICPNCNCNILESGYSCLEKANYRYSKEEKKVKVVSIEKENSVVCSKCNYTIEDLTPSFLENICTIQNCKNCGKDLTSTGIVTKTKTEYDNESNSFISSVKSYHCGECDAELTDYQVNYFKL